MNQHELYDRREEFFLKPSTNARGMIGVCLVVAAVTLGYGFFAEQISPARIWGSVLFNTFFLFSIAVGGVAFCAMQDVIGAVWGRPVRRLHEAFGAFLPAAGLILTVFLLCILFNVAGARDVYSWMSPAEADALHHFWGKRTWLQVPLFAIRDIGALLVIMGVARWQVRLGTKRDAALMAGNRDEALQLGESGRETLRYWSAPVLVIYALCYSLLCFDLLMSLDYVWFSTLWAGWLFAIMMQTLMASLLIAMFVFSSSSLGQIYGRLQFHDIGKFMHGFTIFYAYLTYAHVLTYWYGNVPEETEYFIHRIHGDWIWIVMLTPIFNFVIPLFALIFKAAKWTAPITIPLALMIIVAQWFVYVLVVLPQIGENTTRWQACFLDVGIFLGALGLFLGCYFAFARKHPMVAIADPLLIKALNSQH